MQLEDLGTKQKCESQPWSSQNLIIARAYDNQIAKPLPGSHYNIYHVASLKS